MSDILKKWEVVKYWEEGRMSELQCGDTKCFTTSYNAARWQHFSLIDVIDAMNELHFRVAPKPKRVPLSMDDWKLFQEKGMLVKSVTPPSDIIAITRVGKDGVFLHGFWHNYKALMDFFVFADGTPCSKEV